MTIQQCKYVLKVVETGSFSEAARLLFIAQSSLSVAIKSLEGELNIRIFDRKSGGALLTEDGAEFVRYATEIVSGEKLVAERYSTTEGRQKLFIATQHYDFIADIFGNFLRDVSSEKYKFSIKEIETHNVIREVESGYSDIGIIAIKDGDFDIMRRYLSKRSIGFTPFIKALPHVFFRKEHPMAQRSELALSDMQSYPYVSYEQGEHTASYFTEEMSEGLSHDKHIEISDRATLMNLLLITDAYTVGTGIMPSALNRGDIVSIPIVSDEYYVIGYILNKTRKLSEMAEKFISLIETTVKNI